MSNILERIFDVTNNAKRMQSGMGGGVIPGFGGAGPEWNNVLGDINSNELDKDASRNLAKQTQRAQKKNQENENANTLIEMSKQRLKMTELVNKSTTDTLSALAR